MKLRYILPLFLVTLFTGCLSEEEILKAILGDSVAIDDGNYVSECQLDESGSSYITNLEISNNASQRTIQIDTYTDAGCSAGEVLGTPEDASIELADYGFGNNTSFLTEQNPQDGEIYVPYHVDGNDLYIGVSANSSGEPTEIFSDFIDAPKNSGGTKFTKVQQ